MAGKTSLVSVIIPAYNCAAVIERCAKSVINQSYKNIEIIIINDGSTDNTNDVCKNLAKQYKQIKYFETKNQGVSAARNFGVKKSLGDYILFIDADDTIDKKFIEHCMETASANNVPVVCLMNLLILWLLFRKRNELCEISERNSFIISALICSIPFKILGIVNFPVYRLSLYIDQLLLIIIPDLLRIYKKGNNNYRSEYALYFAVIYLFFVFSIVFLAHNNFYTYQTIFEIEGGL